MNKWMKKILCLILAFMMIGVTGCSSEQESESVSSFEKTTEVEAESTSQDEKEEESVATAETYKDEAIDEDGIYTSKDDVALYLHTYGKLPSNFMTKKEAQALGWTGGGLDDYKKNMCIGGDRFGNYEGVLPEGNYHECDIDTLNKTSRGAKRLVYSDDGDIYYTEDHYETFELLYEGED